MLARHYPILFGALPPWLPRADGVPASVYIDAANQRYWAGSRRADFSAWLTALGGTFTRASTATYTTSASLVATAASGALRFDHTSAGVAKGILLEGARTNLCLQSATMGTTWAASNVTVATDSTTSPDGTANADTLTASAANGTLIQDLGVIASAVKTFSVYLKRLTGTGNIDLTLDGGSTWTTKTITSSWARYEISQTLADPDCGIRIVTSGDAVYAWGGQVEAATFASSYIPTTTATVTRAADALNSPVGSWYNQLAGSKYLVFDQANVATGMGLVGFSDNSTNLRAQAYTNTSAQPRSAFSNPSYGEIGTRAIAANTAVKFMQAWAASDRAQSVDGQTAETSTADVVPTSGITRLDFALVQGVATPLHGHVREFAYFPVRASNAELQRLTT